MGRKGQNTLVILIQSFEGKTLTLELRNDVEVTGEIETVDEQMNVNLKNCKYQTADGEIQEFETFYIRGRQIRYIQIPEAIEIGQAIDDRKRKLKEARELYQRKSKKPIVPNDENAMSM